MTTQFNILRTSRTITLKAIEKLTLAQLHVVPAGHKNNIIWNLVHLLVTQQLLHYKLSGLHCLVPEEWIELHRKGTSPTREFTQEEVDEVKELFAGLPDTLEEDYEMDIFENFTSYPTSTGFVLDSIDTAIAFNNYHEGIHLGVILALKKLV